jgi:hypothetical protein
LAQRRSAATSASQRSKNTERVPAIKGRLPDPLDIDADGRFALSSVEQDLDGELPPLKS